MNKKDVLEIRRQFSPENCAITRICGCYVDGDKEIKLLSKEAFLSMPEEEAFKYYDIFKKTLSGPVGRNLLTMEFPLEAEKPGGRHDFLMQLLKSKLEDDMLLEEFYRKVIEFYDYPENYYIVLIHGNYDIPGKASDGMEMFDASDEVYEYMLCSICPVSLSKAGLSYNAEHNSIEDRIRDWVVAAPVKGFLFPLFEERGTNIHGALYYSKKPDELQWPFIEEVLGCQQVLSSGDQKEVFQTLIADTLGEDRSYEIVKNIHENLNEMLEANKEDPEPLALAKPDVKRLLEESGVPSENLERFEEEYEHVAGEKTTLLASNITNTRQFEIHTPDITIKVNPERTDLVETRVIDGRQCLVIAVDDHVEVNGLDVWTLRQEEDV